MPNSSYYVLIYQSADSEVMELLCPITFKDTFKWRETLDLLGLMLIVCL